MLHGIAKSYSTDPASLLEWDPFRLGLAAACFAQGTATDLQNAERAKAFPVFNVGL